MPASWRRIIGEGDRASGQIDAREIIGPLNRQIADAMVFVARNMRVAARKEPARVDMPQYSDRALFEALVNAVAHRDYSMRGSRIRLSMFEGPPGDPVPRIAAEQSDGGQHGDPAGRPQPDVDLHARADAGGRNPGAPRTDGISWERRGDGVPIILRETRGLCGRPPEYRVIDEAEVRLVIPAAPQEHSPVRTVVNVRSADAGGTAGRRRRPGAVSQRHLETRHHRRTRRGDPGSALQPSADDGVCRHHGLLRPGPA